MPSNARVQVRRRVSADVTWNPLLGLLDSRLFFKVYSSYRDYRGLHVTNLVFTFPSCVSSPLALIIRVCEQTAPVPLRVAPVYPILNECCPISPPPHCWLTCDSGERSRTPFSAQ